MSDAQHMAGLVRTAALLAAIETLGEITKSDGFKALAPDEAVVVLNAVHTEIARIAGGTHEHSTH